MTESKIYADNFKCSFGNSDQFLDFLKERKEKSLWMKAPSNSLQFKPLEKDSELGSLYMQLYQSNGSAEILVDTMENTSLLLSVNGADYPVRSCALKTILERARISGNALGKVSKSVLTQILNYCLDVATGDSLIKVADDKVSAVHGGDQMVIRRENKMANYYASIRTNYFRVKDEKKFREFMAHVSGTEDRVELWEEKDKNGNTVFGFGTLGGIAGVTDYHNNSEDDGEDEDSEADFDAFLDSLQTFVADDDAIIILESGHEKLCYVVGSAYIITKDRCDCLDISDLAVKYAAQLLGNPEWTTICDY